jgi:multiple antibiotic resistance protein
MLHLSYRIILENSLYFLVLINPASKVLFFTSKLPPFTQKEINKLSINSTIAALVILLILASAGNFLFENVFHVEVYSLSIAGGIVLFSIGLNSVRKGKFFESKEFENIMDMSIVPIATPLIAGPGTMAAAISYASINGVKMTLICITIALLLNMALMLTSRHIGQFLEKYHITGPLIRITGLIIAAVAVQMILTGSASWIKEAVIN